MKAHDLAKQAADILNERGQQNGYDNGEERSAAKIAKVFNTITGRDLTEQEAWLFMICLKLVREGNKHQTDNCVDMANYAFLRAESFGVADMKATMTTPPVFGGVPGCVGPGFQTGPSFSTVHDEIQVTIEKPDLLTPEQIQNYVTETVIRATKPGGILRRR